MGSDGLPEGTPPSPFNLNNNRLSHTPTDMEGLLAFTNAHIKYAIATVHYIVLILGYEFPTFTLIYTDYH